MTMMDLEGVPTFLTEKIIFHSALADILAPEIATELTGAGAKDVSQHLREWNPTRTENSGTRPGKQGRGQDFPAPGKEVYAPIEIAYQYDPQGIATDPLNLLGALLVPFSKRFATVRKGPPIEVALAASQKAETWAFICGRRREMKTGDGEYGEYDYAQTLYPQRALAPAAVLAA